MRGPRTQLGYAYLCVNDHLLFGRPWLDGPTALAAVIDESGINEIGHHGEPSSAARPVQLAKTLGALDVLSRTVTGCRRARSSAWTTRRRVCRSASGGDDSTRPCRLCAGCCGVTAMASTACSTERGCDPGATAGAPRRSAGMDRQLGIAGRSRRVGGRRRRLARFGVQHESRTFPDRSGSAVRAFFDGGGRGRPVSQRAGNDLALRHRGSASSQRMITDVLAPTLNRPADLLRAMALPIGPAKCARSD